MRSIGLDLGSREIAFAEAANGKVVARRTVKRLSELEGLLGPDQPPARVAIEACREAWHVHDTLTSWGNEVLLVDTTRARRIGVGEHGRKNDRLDAECYALAVERGGIPAAHVLAPARRALREKLAVRGVLVAHRAELVTTIRGLVRARGEHLPSCATHLFAERVHEAKLSEETRRVIAPLTSLLVTLDEQIAVADVALDALCKTEPVIARLMTTPGVGTIVAATFVSVIDEAKRFESAHRVESYLGLVPREETSGGRQHQKLGSITKQGNAHARAMLVEAAWMILRTRGDNPLREWAQSVAKRRGKRIAVVALARRLAGLLWALWRDGTVYDAARVGVAIARGIRRDAQDRNLLADAMKTSAKKSDRRARKSERTLSSSTQLRRARSTTKEAST